MKRFLLFLALVLWTSVARATITFDFASEGTGTTTFTWSHAGGANPEGGVVACMCSACTTDVISGAKWGASSMTLVGNAIDTVGEPGSVEVYWIGSSVPSGTQTIECTVSSGTDAKHGVAIGVQANGNVQLAGTFCTIDTGDPDDPSCTVTGISGARFGFAFLFSGLNDPTSITAGAGFTLGPDNDYGTKSSISEYESSQGSGNLTAAFTTTAADDVAMLGMAFQQVTADSGFAPRRGVMISDLLDVLLFGLRRFWEVTWARG